MTDGPHFDDNYCCYKGVHGEVDCDDPRCERRDHTCDCGNCCDACWFMCCASRWAANKHIEGLVVEGIPVSNCGNVSLVYLHEAVSEITDPP